MCLKFKMTSSKIFVLYHRQVQVNLICYSSTAKAEMYPPLKKPHPMEAEPQQTPDSQVSGAPVTSGGVRNAPGFTTKPRSIDAATVNSYV
jgi:hypothetical protein